MAKSYSRVLTIYNCGTNFNRDRATASALRKAGELIASLYEKTSHPDVTQFGRLDLPAYGYKLIHDGPGSAPAAFSRWERDAQGIRQHVQHAATESAASTPGLKPGANPISAAVHRLQGTLLGAGWEANVANAIWVVKAFKHRPEVINLAGWSRGGVTCHMIANALYQDPELRNIPVNIFAVDPVPGGFGSHGAERTDVQSNVANYRAVIAIHDRKLAFRPVQIEPLGTHKLYDMPGVHDTAVLGATELHAVPVLVEWLAAKFLESHGTTFTSRLHLTSQQVCENYAIAKKTMPGYAALAGHGATNKVIALGGHAPARAMRTPTTLHAEYFVNWHHLREFRLAFPQVYQLAFGARSREAREIAGLHMLNTMKITCRNSYEQLVQALS